MIRRRHAFAAVATLSVLAGPAHAVSNLIQDGSFEGLTVNPGGYVNYTSVGSALQAGSAWFMGAGTSLNAVSSTYTESPLVFNALQGLVSMDLTGTGNTGANALYQDVATTAGTQYTLSFWVGNADDTRPSYPGPSTLKLSIEGNDVGTFAATATTPNGITWQQFTYSFTAADALTRIAFTNATPSGNNLAGLDDVVLTPVPEASEWAMMLAGLGVVGLIARRRRAGA